MPRFVLLFHECPAESNRVSHWDFMLESGLMLRTWALSANPVAENLREVEIIAEQLPDHRLAYLDYEGPVSHGRGTVERVDAGQFEVLSETKFELALELAGENLGGLWKLSRSSSTASTHWVLRRI